MLFRYFMSMLQQVTTDSLDFAAPELFVLRVPSSVVRHARTLPPAERAVAEAVVDGLSNAQIAGRRGTSLKTVANQLSHLFERFDVHSRTALVHALECSPCAAQLGAP